MQIDCNLCLMSSSSHSRSVDCCPLMDFNLVAMALLKGNLFNMSHIALQYSAKMLWLLQLIINLNTSKFWEIKGDQGALGYSTLEVNVILAGFIIISSILMTFFNSKKLPNYVTREYFLQLWTFN